MATVRATSVQKFVQYTGENSEEVIAGVMSENYLPPERVVVVSETLGVLSLHLGLSDSEWIYFNFNAGDWVCLQGPGSFSPATYAERFFQVD